MAPRARHHIVPALLLVLLPALSLAPAAAGAPQEPADFTLFNRGSVSFQRHCSSCHGTKAKGDGQVAKLLKVQPADLTQLTANNQGEFPEEEVRKMIDGRKDVTGHGQREMPVFGQYFLDGGEGPEAEARVKARIDELVTYLRGIQAK